jgi:hypothetical protein
MRAIIAVSSREKFGPPSDPVSLASLRLVTGYFKDQFVA